MSVTRRSVLEQLAAVSDATQRETTTIEALATTLNTDNQTIESYLDGLIACELAVLYPDGGIRITITGEELLALDTDELAIIDSK